VLVLTRQHTAAPLSCVEVVLKWRRLWSRCAAVCDFINALCWSRC